MPLTDTKFELCRDIEHVLKIGREFQKQDAWRGAHHDTVKLLCDTIEHLRDQSNAQAGNGVAMRNAMVKCRELAETIWQSEGGEDVSSEIAELKDTIDAALATPPRNCDRKFADHPTMYYEFRDWCHKKGHTMEPLLASDAFDWLLATKKEGAK